MTGDKSTADLVVGDQAVMLPGGRALAARIVTVSRVTATQIIVETGTDSLMRFNRKTGRRLGRQNAWHSISILHPESDRGREWARQAKLDQARTEAQAAVRRLRDALDDPHHADDEVLGMSGDVASAVRHYLRARKDGTL